MDLDFEVTPDLASAFVALFVLGVDNVIFISILAGKLPVEQAPWQNQTMPEPVDLLGPILELMSWMGFVPGIPLIITGWVITKYGCRWASTTAEVFEAGKYKGLRWSDSGNTPHLSLHTAEQTRGLEPGAEVLLHYEACHPARWSLGEPRHDNPVLIVG